MKALTQEEFEDRTKAEMRARGIFIDSGVTNNITVAFELYQKILAEREREIFLSTKVYGNRPRTYMDRYELPKCPDCGFEMQFRLVPENDEGIKCQLVCSNPDHTGEGSVLNSDNDIAWWQANLRIKDASQ